MRCSRAAFGHFFRIADKEPISSRTNKNEASKSMSFFHNSLYLHSQNDHGYNAAELLTTWLLFVYEILLQYLKTWIVKFDIYGTLYEMHRHWRISKSGWNESKTKIIEKCYGWQNKTVYRELTNGGSTRIPAESLRMYTIRKIIFGPKKHKYLKVDKTGDIKLGSGL